MGASERKSYLFPGWLLFLTFNCCFLAMVCMKINEPLPALFSVSVLFMIIILIIIVYDYHINHHNNLIACNLMPPCILALPQPFLPDMRLDCCDVVVCCFRQYGVNLVVFVFLYNIYKVTLIEFVFRQYIVNLVVFFFLDNIL